jgi:hypothetical protein
VIGFVLRLGWAIAGAAVGLTVTEQWWAGLLGGIAGSFIGLGLLLAYDGGERVQ